MLFWDAEDSHPLISASYPQVNIRALGITLGSSVRGQKPASEAGDRLLPPCDWGFSSSSSVESSSFLNEGQSFLGEGRSPVPWGRFSGLENEEDDRFGNGLGDFGRGLVVAQVLYGWPKRP